MFIIDIEIARERMKDLQEEARMQRLIKKKKPDKKRLSIKWAVLNIFSKK